MNADALPKLVEIPGDIVGTPPYHGQGCVMQSLFLAGQVAAQQAFIDRLLVEPAGGALSFTVPTGAVMLAAVYAETMGSLDPHDAQKGVIREWDIGFWTGVWGGLTAQPASWTFYWVPSFLFVDTGSAMAAGREIFGYPKTVAGWSRGPVVPEDAAVSLDVLHYPVFGPTERPIGQTLVFVERAANVTAVATGKLDVEFWHSSGIPPQLLAGMDPVPQDLSLTIPQLLLRQVRDAAQPDRASLQAATVVEIKTSNFAGAGRIPGRWSVTVAPSASHPICATLGLAPTTTTDLACWVRQDFTVPAARYLWKAA
ncbi:MAG: hypothetical protein JWQ76_960 [Ramlibacter sp.]|nr:hypothetical protein [Ramlibacter sp.]